MANAQSITVETFTTGKCRSCGAAVIWAITVNGKCKDAEKWRKP